jgi:AbrB family looped-hinge helix DNA binding protein
MSTRGQVVIPKAVRTHMSLHEGDMIDFVVLENGDVVIKSRARNVTDLSGILKGKVAGESVTIEQMNDAIGRVHSRV